MKDGVEYVLRFGAGTTVTEAGKAGSEEDGDAPEESAETAARYLLVMAQFNENLLEQPDLVNCLHCRRIRLKMLTPGNS